MRPFLAQWFTTALALSTAAWVLPGVTISSVPALAIGATVLGIVNAVVKPVLVILTLPLTFLTLGIFYFVVNGIAFSLAAWMVPGFTVSSLWWAMLGAGLVGFVSMFIGGFRRPHRRRHSQVDVDVIDVRPS